MRSAPTDITLLRYTPTDFTDLHRLSGCVVSPTEFTEFTEVWCKKNPTDFTLLRCSPTDFTLLRCSPTDFTDLHRLSGRVVSPTEFTDVWCKKIPQISQSTQKS